MRYTPFASEHEAERYAELKLEQSAGEITELELQKHYSLDANGVHICDYVADFVYKRNGALVTQDEKGQPTELYLVTIALMRQSTASTLSRAEASEQ